MEAFRGVIFDSHDETFRCPQGAIPCGQNLTLRILISRALDAYGVTLRLWADGAESMLAMNHSGYFVHTPYGDFLDEYSLNVSRETSGLVWYQFTVNTSSRPLYICNGEAQKGGPCRISEHPQPEHSFQITFTEADFSTPDWAKGAIMYQIFPDRFFRAPGSGDDTGKRLHENWFDMPDYRPDPDKGYYPADDFFGGNLKGIEAKLPYLHALHVDVLYLNPIFKAYSNHRYDTGDYETVDPLLGTNEDLEALCRAAAKMNIRVILDGVFSHTGSDSRYFNREGSYPTVGAFQSKDSPYASWYDFEEFPHKYDCWWGVWSLPCVKENDPGYRQYMLAPEKGIVRRWLKAGISGWRLDVADELPDDFLQALRQAVKEEDPDALVLGEVWEDASNKISYDTRREFLYGRELDTVMNYPLRNALFDYVSQKISAEEFCADVLSLRENYPPEAFSCLMNFLSTHDLARFTTALTGDTDPLSREEQACYCPDAATLWQAKRRHRIAASVLFALPGMPCIYYGDEAGLEGCRDPFNRKPYPWQREDAEMLDWYRMVTACRDEVLRKGKLYMEAAGSLLSVRREYGGDWRYLLVNAGDETVETLLDSTYFRSEPQIIYDTADGIQLGRRENGYYLLLPPCSVVLLRA